MNIKFRTLAACFDTETGAEKVMVVLGSEEMDV